MKLSSEKHISKFAEAYKRLNPEQKKAVDAIDGPVMVIAGPGTGKTEILTMRAANILVKTDTPPEGILALTFTESGVASMRKRLAELIGIPAYRAAIITFHGFANGIIKEYPDYFPEIIGSNNITEVEQVRILRNIIDATFLKALKPFGDKYYYLKEILKAVNELKQQGISPEKFYALIKEEKEKFKSIEDLYYESGPHKGKMKGARKEDQKHIERNEDLAVIYKKYQKSLRDGKQYDYSDMIMQAMTALEKEENLRLALQEKYLYILVDEHQDTNKAQNRILELLASYFENPNLFVVGDEKQAIFRFQGASLENFLYFKKIYKNVVLIPLKNNYRSTQTILDAAQKISPREISLSAQAGHFEKPIKLSALSSPEVEYYFVAQKVKELLEQKVIPEEIAVLYRENRDAVPLARMLGKQNIPFTVESDQDALGDEDIRKLMIILETIENFGTPSYLLEFLHLDFFNIPPFDVYKIFFTAFKKKINPYEIIKSESLLAGAEVESKTKLLELYRRISLWKLKARNQNAAETFEDITRESGFLAHILNQPGAIEKVAKLHALFEHLKALIENSKNYTLENFFSYLALVKEHNVIIRSSETVRFPGRIRLMTAHKSKGLEFEHVFIINAVDGKWGSRRRPEHIKLPRRVYTVLESVEEALSDDGDERNIFYVALTRAKKDVYISYGKKNRDGKEQLPTQFIQEMKEEILSLLDVGSYEKEFAARRELEFAPSFQTKPKIKDKSFLNKIFEEQGLSVTALNNYLVCPWKYFYLNLIRVPEAPNKHLMYGNAVHSALKDYFDLLARGEKKDKNYLLRCFESALNRQPFKQNDYKEALEKGKKSLSNYYDARHNSWIARVINELKIDGVELEPGARILGKLDKIEFLDNGNGINVVDYKTGQPRTRNEIEGKTKNSAGDYKRQLIFYRLLLDKTGKYKMISGEIDFIEPDKKGKSKKECFEISQEEVDALEKQIIEVAREIRGLVFWNKFCGEPDCRYCEFRKELI